MPLKKLRLAPHEFELLAKGFGSCFATHRITRDGAPVGYMYREQTDNDLDSGWRLRVTSPTNMRTRSATSSFVT
jgi:hypothetical protein